MFKRALIIIVLSCLHISLIYGQKAFYRIGILSDYMTDESVEILEKVKKEIIGVVGEDAHIDISDERVLVNNFDVRLAEENYQKVLGNSDIILAFGPINNVVISQKKVHRKPTVLFGSSPMEFAALDHSNNKSGIHNLVYFVSSQSFKKDLDDFHKIFHFRNIGILVNKSIAENFPVNEVLQDYFKTNQTSFEVVPYEYLHDLSADDLSSFDAVYLGGFRVMTKEEVSNFAKLLIDLNIPSFTSTTLRDVELGLLATNQTNDNIDQVIRRIALSIESIVNGRNPAELSLYIDNDYHITINVNTAQILNIPLRYSMIGSTSFTGDFNNSSIAEKNYTLKELMLEALEENLFLKSSNIDIELSKQDLLTAKSQYRPEISFNATGIYLDPKLARVANGQNPEITSDLSLKVSQLIFSPQASANIEIEESQILAQSEINRKDQLDVVYNISNAYINALLTKTTMKINYANLELSKSNLTISEHNYESGATGKSDILRFRSQVAQNSQQLIEAVNQNALSMVAINQLLNKPLNRIIEVEEIDLDSDLYQDLNYKQLAEIIDDPMLVEPFIQFLVNEAINNAPELRSIDYNLDIIERGIKLATASRYAPTIAVQGQLNQNILRAGEGTESPAGFPLPPRNDYNIGLNITVPLYQGKRPQINEAIGNLQKDKLLIDKQNIELQIEQMVVTNVMDLINKISNIELSKVSLDAAEESLDLVQESYQQGAVSSIQLIDAQNNYINAQQNNASSIFLFVQSALQLERSIGYFFLLENDAKNEDFKNRFFQFMTEEIKK